ncbi:MAG: helix-turn-helix domain-containing protein [Candidatus Nanopelagicales bacterium]
MEAAAGARLRRRRQELGLSLRELGSRVGVSASMLSQVENGRCRASVAVLYRLVNELGLTLDDLFDDASPAPEPEPAEKPRSRSGARGKARGRAPRTPVLTRGERVTIELESGVTWEKLSNAAPPGLEFILVTYRPGSSSGKSGKFSQHEGFECAYVVSGELTFHHKFDTWTLTAGDTITFDAAEPHRLENHGTEDVVAVWLVLHEAAAAGDAARLESLAKVVGATRRPT